MRYKRHPRKKARSLSSSTNNVTKVRKFLRDYMDPAFPENEDLINLMGLPKPIKTKRKKIKKNKTFEVLDLSVKRTIDL